MPPNNSQYIPPTGAPGVPPAATPIQPTQPPVGAPTPGPLGSAPAPAATAPRNPNSAQNSLKLSEVRDSMVIMADGTFRAVIACQSINFDLMSDREREGVEYSYQNFLNSLNFPVQILVRSQRVDIGPYIDKLLEVRRSQDNMLLGVLMDDYINFIDVLSQEANIMDKSFYITIPYFPNGDAQNLLDQGKGFFGKLFAKPVAVTRIDNNTYQKAKSEIKNRVDSVMAGLFQIGVQSVQLNTKELGELYYNFYNPDTAVREPLGNFENATSLYVRRGAGANPATTQQGGVQ